MSWFNRTPFEKRYGYKFLFYNETIDFGLYLRLRPSRWMKVFWGHPEADAIWFIIGPFAFFTAGKFWG